MNKTQKVFIFSIALTCFLSSAICFSAEVLKEVSEIPVPKRFLNDDFKAIFAPVREFYGWNEFSNAAAECQRIIEKHPDDKDVLLYAYAILGQILLEDEDYIDALDAYRKALANFPEKDKSYQLQLGRVRTDIASIDIELGRYDEALAILLKHIKEYPDPIGLRTRDAAKAVAMLKMCFPQETDKLLKLLEQLWEDYKGKQLGAYILYEIACCHENQEQYESAIIKFKELVDTFPNNKLVVKAEGCIRHHKENIEYASRREKLDKVYEKLEMDDSFSVPMGFLGHPLGTYLTIEGASGEWTEKVPNTLFVYRINGERLPRGLYSIQICIDNVSIGTLAKGTRCIFRGYETGEMRGVPREIVKEERLKRPEEPWGFYRYFVVTSIVTPEGLKVEEPTAKPWGK